MNGYQADSDIMSYYKNNLYVMPWYRLGPLFLGILLSIYYTDSLNTNNQNTFAF